MHIPSKKPFVFAFPMLGIGASLLFTLKTCEPFEPQELLLLSTGEVEALSGRSYKAFGNIINEGDE